MRPTFRECYTFPVSSPEARRDLLVGGTLLLAPLVGWVLNLGHRLEVIGRVCRREPPYFRGFNDPPGRAMSRGFHAFGAIALYLTPAAVAGAGAFVAWRAQSAAVFVLTPAAIALFALAVYVLPGGMTFNAAYDDMSYLYRPDKALKRAVAGGAAYLHAWSIGLSAIALTPLGFFAFGIGFFYASVWAWGVVGYAFTRALVLESPP